MENLFTTKMSQDAKKLGHRLHHILHPAKKGTKILSTMLLILLLLVFSLLAVQVRATIMENQAKKAELSAKNTVIEFFDAFAIPDYEKALSFGTEKLLSGYCERIHKMCYGMTRAELLQIRRFPNAEFLARYERGGYSAVSTLTDDELTIMDKNPDFLMVFSVSVMAEHNIKGEVYPAQLRVFDVLCQKQEDGSYRIHKFLD